MVRSAIAAYGDTIHSFVERENYSRPLPPRATGPSQPIADDGPDVGIQLIDHIVCNVELGQDERMGEFYARVLGFDQLVHFRDDQISSEYTALMSKVMWDGVGRVKLPINEPAPSKKKSQIDEYLEFYRGPGVQHIAMLSKDIVSTVDALRRRGVKFIRVPQTYYEAVRGTIGTDRREHRRDRAAEHPGRPRRGGLPPADLHEERPGPPDGLARPDAVQPRQRTYCSSPRMDWVTDRRTPDDPSRRRFHRGPWRGARSHYYYYLFVDLLESLLSGCA